MREANRVRKAEIKYDVTLNEEQKIAKDLIRNNKVVIITGRAGCGKSLVAAQTSLDFLFKGECQQVFVTRPTVEAGESLGYLPGSLEDKYNPYIEAFLENLIQCYDKSKIDYLVKDKQILGCTVQFIRGKTIRDVLVVEEAQNLTKHQMLAILTRLGKTGKIIINGDLEQQDTRDQQTGLHYVIELSKKIEEIKWIKLKENHRDDLVGKILEYEYGN